MRQRHLGRNGIAVSRLGLATSTWGVDSGEEDAERQLRTFVDTGGTLVATTGSSRAERLLGKLVGHVVPRADVVLAVAGGTRTGTSRAVDATRTGLLSQIDTTLRNLVTDYVDLYQVRRWSASTPIEETMSALDEILASGRARAVGVCDYSGWQTAVAGQRQRSNGVRPLSTVQVEYSVLARHAEREVTPAADALGLGVLASAPLGHDVLAAKHRDDVVVDAVVACADELGTTPTAVAISWVRDRPAVVAPLIGVATAEELSRCLAAEHVDLPVELTEQLDKVSDIRMGYPERFGPPT
jgi:aryl-alcohol dehydrogenase-like predicted oxidoreductase